MNQESITPVMAETQAKQNEVLLPLEVNEKTHRHRKLGSKAILRVTDHEGNEITDKNPEVKEIETNSMEMIKYGGKPERLVTKCSIDSIAEVVELSKIDEEGNEVSGLYIQNSDSPIVNKDRWIESLDYLTSKGGYSIKKVVILNPRKKEQIAYDNTLILTEYLSSIVHNLDSGKDAQIRLCEYDESYLDSKEGVKLSGEFTKSGKTVLKVNNKAVEF
ncbi:hypothetical protein HGB24_00425 [Candidatus Saccharibacteria bacterium]|nr:hypothetical protein [Candidatus Saccharibacteria bacterium]